MKLTVVIVNYNVKFYLEQCLRSLAKATEGIESEVYVVDNDSSDGSVSYLREKFPDVIFVENKENVGFARANNIAIRRSQSEYVLLINPDTFVGENFIHDCIELLDNNTEIGATGARMINLNGSFASESRRGIPTPSTAFYKMSGLCSMFPKSRTFGRYYMKYLDEYQVSPIEIISGACMFIRRSVLEECGLLDEQFFMYGEDIDLSYRMLKTGKKNYYIPSRILHYKGESTKKNTYRYVYVFYQAMYLFFKKHFGHYGLLLSVPIKTAIYLAGASEFLMRKLKGLFEKKHTLLYYMQRNRYLLKGSNRNLESMAAICEKNGLTFDISEVSGVVYDYVVYDTDAYQFSTILEEMEQRYTEAAKEKKNPYVARLATYSSSNDIILTAEMAFEN